MASFPKLPSGRLRNIGIPNLFNPSLVSFFLFSTSLLSWSLPPNGTYAEAYFFEPSFPFSDIRNVLPVSPKVLPFHIENINGFL